MAKSHSIRHENANDIRVVGPFLRDVIGIEQDQEKHLSNVGVEFFGVEIIHDDKEPEDLNLKQFLMRYWMYMGKPNGLIDFHIDDDGLTLRYTIPEAVLQESPARQLLLEHPGSPYKK